MPKKARELAPLEVKRITQPGYHAVGGVAGLLLRVSDTGARSWILRYTARGDLRTSSNGKPYAARRDLGLGGFPDVTLAQARERAREAREKIRAGIDPIRERRQGLDTLTFASASERFLAQKAHEFRNAKHASQWRNTLRDYANPVIGQLPVDEIELNHIVRIIEPIWLTKTETAKRLRGRIESVLAWATVSGYRQGDNPARWKGHLDAILPAPSKVAKVRHHAALPWQEVGALMAELRGRDGMGARALEFCILTAARSGEVRGARWDEIDMQAELWTIPGERMKAGNAHRVPLSKQAKALLETLPRMEGNSLVFPAPRGGVLSDATLAAVVKRIGLAVTVHGFRSTFRDWCAEATNYPRDVAEMALAHTIGNAVEAAYRRGDLFTKRTRLMQSWADYCDRVQDHGEVVAIQNGA